MGARKQHIYFIEAVASFRPLSEQNEQTGQQQGPNELGLRIMFQILRKRN